jgi:two-component system sensor histidine kinase KdpD
MRAISDHLSYSPRQVLNALFALLITIGFTVILFLLRQVLSTPIVALLYLVPVLVSSSLWGLGAGVLASVGAFLAFNYFFIVPYYTFEVHQAQDLIAVFIFLTVGIVTSQLVGRIRAGLAEAQAKEQEIRRLYELSKTLVVSRYEEEVARHVANDLAQILDAQVVHLIITLEHLTEPLIIIAPEDVPLRFEPPAIIYPLVTSRGQLGKIVIWRSAHELAEREERILQAYAGQGALALERAILEKIETKTHILEESDRMKSALLSSVSHELRTPLVTIKAAVTSLRSGEVKWDSEARDDLLAALDEEADRLNSLVGDLLNMSRIEAGALKLQNQWNVLADIVDAVVARLKSRTMGHLLEVDISEDLPLVWVDQTLIQHVFANLIDNSVKYSPPGTPITMRALFQNDSHLLVEIANRGPRIPEEHLQNIFERFHRVTDADRVPGTGLGLSICKGIMDAHGEHIWVENLPDGLAFKFTLSTQQDSRTGPGIPLKKI